MKCGICGMDKLASGVPMRDIAGHKRREHPQEWRDQRARSLATRRANAGTLREHVDLERVAKVEGREAGAMPMVKQGRAKGLNLVHYEVGITSEIAWSTYSSGELNTYYPYRLLDLEPQAAYTALQNQIDSLQTVQQTILAGAFEEGAEVTQEHLEAVQAAGERAVERLNAEGG